MRPGSKRLSACLLAGVLGLAGCATTQTLPPLHPGDLLHDERFDPPSAPVATAGDVFALSPPMRAFIRGNAEFLKGSRVAGERQALIDALYSRYMLKLEYEASKTRDAAEAFEARRGNCLSLVIMTAAFAHELGLPVRFQSVQIDDAWSRSGDLSFGAGHINLSLGYAGRTSATRGFSVEADTMIVDFVPAAMLIGQRSIVVDETTVAAMYMNNRAAELLGDGHLQDAYWWARQAMLTQPRYFAAYNTLAVIYRRHGDTLAAEAALSRVLAHEPGNLSAQSNRVLVLRDLGRNSEADRLQAQLRETQPHPPFYFFDNGVLAMARGDYETARADFQKEIDRAAYYHEFHFWLALANYALGDYSDARKQVALALENSTTARDHDIYTAKLGWLDAHKPAKPSASSMQRW